MPHFDDAAVACRVEHTAPGRIVKLPIAQTNDSHPYTHQVGNKMADLPPPVQGPTAKEKK